jgi:hypothetical protein
VPLLALLATLSVAVREPVAVGLNCRITVQLAPTARLLPVAQVPVRVKSARAVPDSVKPERLKAAAPLLLTVIVWVALLWPSTVAGKLSVLALSATVACGWAVPDPAKVTDVLPPVALCVITRLALRAPTAEGVKATLATQLLPAATEPPEAQVPPLARAKSAEAAPEMVKLLRIKAAVPVLLTVTFCAVPVLPTVWLKVSEVGEAEIAGEVATPVPESATTAGLPPALVAMFKLPERAPAAEGVNTSPTVQEAPAATLPPATQLPPLVANSVEVVLRLLKLRLALPVLVTVSVWALEVLPTVTEPKAKVALLSCTAGAGGAVAVPEAATDKVVLGAALCVIDTVVARVPAAVGVKFSVSVHEPPAATEALALQVEALATAKSPACPPLTPTEVMVKAAVPLLFKVRLWLLVLPTLVLAMPMLLADSVA